MKMKLNAFPSLCIFLFIFGLFPLWAQEGGNQCFSPETPFDNDDECAFQSKSDGKMLHIRLYGGQELHFPLGPDQALLEEAPDLYKYNSSANLLSFYDLKGRLIFLNIDPYGRYPSQFEHVGTFWNKVCQIFPFPYSFDKGIRRLGRHFKLNGGILFSRKSEDPSQEKFIIRSRNMDLKKFAEINDKIQEKNLGPVVSSACLERFGPKILKLKCSDPLYSHQVRMIQEEIKMSSCAPYLYKGGPGTPVVIHLHATGFGGKDGRGDYALEQLKLAEVFGYRFFHPFHKDHPTPLTGGDILRPVFFQKNEKEDRVIKDEKITSRSIFDFAKSDQAVEKIYREEKDEAIREKKLGEVMDKFHFYNPYTMVNFFSSEARACLKLTPELIENRRKDSQKFTGSWKNLLEILNIIVDQDSPKVFFHCHGGRHKTGVLALSVRYLQDPRWLYGPKMKMSFGLKSDAHSGEENLSWSEDNQAFWERYQFELNQPRESGLKNFIHLVFLPEKGWFNPAEMEYISHNEGQVRMSNITATRDLFRLLYESHNKAFLSQMKEKYHLDDSTIEELILRLKALKGKMEAK